MLTALRWLVVRLAALRFGLKFLAGFGLLIPLVFVLKVVGLPLLGILGIVALPLLFVLFILGLPIFAVLLVGGVLLGLLSMALTLGLVALKVALFVVLPIWVVVRAVKWMSGARKTAPVVNEGPAPQ